MDKLDQKALDAFTKYSVDKDAIPEIESLKLLSFDAADDGPPRSARLVLVLVEPRILEPLNAGPSTDEVLRRLRRLKDDLWLEGYSSRFIAADIYSGNKDQDGRCIVAMRRFLMQVNACYRNLQGLILIGAFPEATVVRDFVRRKDEVKLTIRGTEHEGNLLQIKPGLAAPRSDVVLGDLAGYWDEIYQFEPVKIDSIQALADPSIGNDWPRSNAEFVSARFLYERLEFRDSFICRDGRYEVLEHDTRRPRLRLKVWPEPRNLEVAMVDRLLPNPLACPTLHVSRINPFHVAVTPDPEFRDKNDRGFLSADGKPQAVETNRSMNPDDHFKRDRAFERRLLIEYLDRNHRYRADQNRTLRFRSAAIAYPAADDFSAVRLARYLDEASTRFEPPVTFDDASLSDYVRFLKTPATLKGILAHSSPTSTSFGKSYRPAELLTAIGGHFWRWTEEGETRRYVPTVGTNGRANFYFSRSVYENRVLAESSDCFYIHQGCSVNAPEGVEDNNYLDEDYAPRQNGESILFYLNGLALVSRAKVFNDRPEGFPKAFGASPTACFGDGLRAYFERDAHDAGLATLKKVSTAKRAYAWGILGDWTLRLRYDLFSEALTRFKSGATRVLRTAGGWLLSAGEEQLLMFPSQAEALAAEKVIEHYGADALGVVGRPHLMTYLLVDGKAPQGAFEGERSVRFNVFNLTILQKGQEYHLLDDNEVVVLTCPNFPMAEAAARTLRKYSFTKQCFAGETRTSLMYFRK